MKRRRLLPLLRVSCCIALPLAAAARAFAADEPKAPDAAPYEDKLIEGGALAPLAEEGGTAEYNPEGLARAWRIEGFASRLDQGGTIRNENGMLLSARLDTLQYGALSLDASARTNPSSTVATIWQRGMPFDHGWRANNAIGMLNTPGIDLSRSQYRFYMPTFPIAGVQSEWLQGGRLQVQASAGEPGIYDGLRVQGFSRLGGTLYTGAAQFNPDPAFSAGFQFVQARDVNASTTGLLEDTHVNASSWYGAAAWTASEHRFQLNAIDSTTERTPHRMALWMDAELHDGRLRHNFGAFRFEPGVAWGYSPISGDLQGGYYRANYASQQWIWSAGVDSATSVSDRGPNAVYTTGNVRYQLDHSTGVGGGAGWRHSGNDATDVFAFVDELSRFGTSRVQVESVDTWREQHARQLTIDQTWPTQAGLRISTAISLGQQRTPELDTRRIGIAAYGGIDLTNTLSLDGSVRFTRDRDVMQTIGRYVNLGLVWRISPKWTLLATYYDNRSDLQPLVALAPIIPTEPIPIVPRDRAVFLTVRYEDHAGTPMAPLGGLPGTGAGTLEGSIFYDANDDGLRNAGEKGAPNVTVVLDGKFGARTDNDGRFSFPLVASGPHVITVIPDNLALPYSVSNDGRREITIRTRETTRVDIPATRVR